eukprot:6763892-Karenia_brevis.AAC.1
MSASTMGLVCSSAQSSAWIISGKTLPTKLAIRVLHGRNFSSFFPSNVCGRPIPFTSTKLAELR